MRNNLPWTRMKWRGIISRPIFYVILFNGVYDATSFKSFKWCKPIHIDHELDPYSISHTQIPSNLEKFVWQHFLSKFFGFFKQNSKIIQITLNTKYSKLLSHSCHIRTIFSTKKQKTHSNKFCQTITLIYETDIFKWHIIIIIKTKEA